MTQVITRYFEDAQKARMVKRSLELEGFPPSDLAVVASAESAGTLVDADVDAGAVAAYKERLGTGGAVLLAKASYKPLGAAALVREMTSKAGATLQDGITEEVFVSYKPSEARSILANHPRFLTRRTDPNKTNFHMADWPIPLINRRKPMDAFAFPRHMRMANFPIPLLSRRKPNDNFAFPRHARMANFPIPLISKRKPWDEYAFPRHARMANFPIPLISKRKPYNDTAIGRHTRMANWPFPLLMNGELHTNSLMPGGPRMANFPISLLSNRKPVDKFAFPRHARMANFPISLLSSRKPYTGSIVPEHGRMADMFLPLVIKHSQEDAKKGFSLSKLLRLPTLLPR